MRYGGNYGYDQRNCKGMSCLGATVSNILNDKPGASENTREMVLKVAREMDYMPTTWLKT